MKQMVSAAGDTAYTSWMILGVSVCRRSWQILHSMGFSAKIHLHVVIVKCLLRVMSSSSFRKIWPGGSKRFGKLWAAARDDLPAPPVDLRYLSGESSRVGCYAESSVRGDICSFLEYLYEGVAETLPDYRDELGTGTAVQINVNDPYADQLHVTDKSTPSPEERVDSEMAPPKKNHEKPSGK